ncbi:MCE family protein [Nocardia otitidiscaviarum]|uniref:MCE family protein n=1 Tax=Nocardia otitidiscaviarum TaxID=1823 RepID=UPI0004A6FAD6|nr:MlaD family protein [Nocardia otitidiscaviarum]MBF6132133.1 MCE family protein [Nocardia otitidiscaviarum]MBF6483263.1 MCE family protein [Nocardia otitidiscaviarum]
MSNSQRHRFLASGLTLALGVLVGGGYLLFDVMRVRPPGSTYTVTIQLDRSGGLQAGNNVTWRGYRIGEITAVELTDAGAAVAVRAEVDNRYRIPKDTAVQVHALSAAGEQYIDFVPNTDRGPYLDDGAVVPFDAARTSTPVPLSEVLIDTNELIAQIDPDKFAVILDELDIALSGGPDQFRAFVNGISLAVAGLDNLLPQTTNLITSLRTIAATTSQAQPDLGTLTRNSRILIDQVTAADAEIRALLDDTPGMIEVAARTLDRNADPITSLATNLSAVVRAAQLRIPALRALFPSLLIGTSAMGVPAHDGEFYTIVDIWPRPFCQYPTKQTPQYVVQDGTFRRWNYCVNPPAEQQIRGSGNAPRPNVPDNGANQPTGVDPNERTLPPVR